MKYIRLFEQANVGVSWKLIIDNKIIDNFVIAKLDKLGMSKNRQVKFVEHHEDLIRNTFYINCAIIMIDNNIMGKKDKFSWSFTVNGASTKKVGYEYQGEILLTKEEEEECILKNDAKKYNL